MRSKFFSTEKWKSTFRCKYVFVFALVFGSSFIFLSLNYSTEIRFIDYNITSLSMSGPSNHYEIFELQDTFTIKTEGCTISGLVPFDETVKKFATYPNTIKECMNMNSSLLDSNTTHIWPLKHNLYFYNISDYAMFNCCYRAFNRPKLNMIYDKYSRYIDDRVKYDDCITFDDSIEIMDEFVRVTCNYNQNDGVYEQFFVTPSKKYITPPKSSISKNQYNVILMGIDAVSRMNFHRTMPKTLAFLQQREVIELLGYNKLGDNTFPNVIPLLLGIREEDLEKTCVRDSRSTFDKCPFVWDWYKESGYNTAFGEDSAYLGTFNYLKAGFSGTPTDHYLYTFTHESEKHVGNNKDFNSFLCMGNKYYFNVLLDYITDLTDYLKSSKLFGFFWEVTMSHDYLNYPVIMDSSYEEFLVNLEDVGYLDKTILILLSDHGIRWGDIRKTKQGRLEERLPFVYLLVPPSFRANYETAYNNLRTNTRRLTTPFDLHETLMDLVNVNLLNDEHLEVRSKTSYANERGISLFLPVPGNRTCKSAGIEDHWCTCNKEVKLKTDELDVHDATSYLLTHLNKLLYQHKQCARLNITEIIFASEMDAIAEETNNFSYRELIVVVKTTPGNALFEATLRKNGSDWRISGTVSRLNLYGEQSRCVDSYHLKLYCYCV